MGLSNNPQYPDINRTRSLPLGSLTSPGPAPYESPFKIEYRHTNYYPSELLGPFRMIWEAEGLFNQRFVDIGSGLGTAVLAAASDKHVATATGVEINQDSINFSNLMIRKYGRHPDVLACLADPASAGPVNLKYGMDAMGARFIRSAQKSDRPYIPTAFRVPIGYLVEIL